MRKFFLVLYTFAFVIINIFFVVDIFVVELSSYGDGLNIPLYMVLVVAPYIFLYRALWRGDISKPVTLFSFVVSAFCLIVLMFPDLLLFLMVKDSWKFYEYRSLFSIGVVSFFDSATTYTVVLFQAVSGLLLHSLFSNLFFVTRRTAQQGEDAAQVKPSE